MSVLKIATLGGIEMSKNVGTYSATANTEIGALVKLNDSAKTFTTVASTQEAKEATYILGQATNADFNSVLGKGTNYYVVSAGEMGRLFYLPAFVGIKEGIEIGGDIITTGVSYTVGDTLVAAATGKFVKIADATGYAVSLVIREIIKEYDFDRYVVEIVIPAETSITA